MSDDLIERLEARISKRLMYYDEKAAALDREAAARIRELESRLATAEADRQNRAQVYRSPAMWLRSLKLKADE